MKYAMPESPETKMLLFECLSIGIRKAQSGKILLTVLATYIRNAQYESR